MKYERPIRLLDDGPVIVWGKRQALDARYCDHGLTGGLRGSLRMVVARRIHGRGASGE